MDTNSEPGDSGAGQRADPGASLMQWRDLLQVLLERRWTALAVFAAVFLGTAIWTFRQVPTYQASARIQVDMARQNILNMPDVTAAEPFFLYNQYINTLVRELKSRGFAERVARVVAKEAPALVSGLDDLAATVMRALDARPVKDSRLVDVVVEHARPDLAALLANTAGEQFVQLHLERRVGDASDAVAWLREQVEVQRERLAVSETALRDYRDRTRTVSLEQRQDIVVAKLKSISESLTTAELERLDAETRWREVEAAETLGDAEALAAVAAVEPAVQAARTALLDKRAEAGTLARRYKDAHPAMIALHAELAELETRLRASTDEALSAVRARYTAAKANEDALAQALRQQEEQALSLDRLLVEYEELKRTADADRDLYEALLARFKQTDVAGKLETNNLRLIDRAQPPTRPFRPNRPSNLARGAGAGIILGVLAAFVISLSDDRILRLRSRGGSFGVPLLAVIPRVDSDSPGLRARVAAESVESAPAEAFRSLRANLVLAEPGGRPVRRILVTGTGKGDGKSLVAANLAIVLASHGERTLLVDADLRRPSVRRAFITADDDGRHPLTHEMSLEQAALPTSIPNLHVLAPGRPLANPAELLASPRMEWLLSEASRYDRVVIDSPPLFSVSDPVILLPRVDGVVLVARYAKSRQGLIRDALHLLREGRATVLGIVLNSVSARGHAYYYGHYNAYYDSEPAVRRWPWSPHVRRTPALATTPVPVPPPRAAPAMALVLSPPPVVAEDAAATREIQALEQQGRFDEASRRAESLADREPRGTTGWLRSVECLRRIGDGRGLERLATRIRQAHGADHGLTRLAEAHLAYGRGAHREALAAYTDAGRLLPDCPEAMEGQMRAALMMGDHARVQSCADALLQRDPGNATALYGIGALRITAGDRPAAIAALQQSVDRLPDPEALNNLAWLHAEAGALTQARELARRAVSIQSSLHPAWDTLGGILLKAGDIPEAIRAFETAVALAPGDDAVVVNLIDACARGGLTDRAVTLAGALRDRERELTDDQRAVLARLRRQTAPGADPVTRAG